MLNNLKNLLRLNSTQSEFEVMIREIRNTSKKAAAKAPVKKESAKPPVKKAPVKKATVKKSK